MQEQTTLVALNIQAVGWQSIWLM